MSRSRSAVLVIVVAIAAVCLVVTRACERTGAPAPTTGAASASGTPSSAQGVAPASAASPSSKGGAAPAAPEPTTIYAHNLLLRKGPQFRVYVRWIRGEMLRTHTDIVPSFDDPESFLLEIRKGVIRANIGDISNFLNANMPKGAPLTNISIAPAGDGLKLRGTVHKILPLPIELDGKLSPTADGRVQFHVSKIDVLKLPVKGLLGGFHVQLSDMVSANPVPGVQLAGNDIFFDTQKLLPPPHIHGEISSITVRPPDLELIYGGARNNEDKLARWHNFLRLTGGALDFGRLTMHPVDLTMIDASQDPWFDLDLVNYQAQLVNGYTRMTSKAGLEIYMPDVDDGAPKRKKASQAITLEWLRDRSTSVPADVPVK